MTDNTIVTRGDLNATLRRLAKALGFHSSDFRTYGFERHLEEALADTAEQPTPPEPIVHTSGYMVPVPHNPKIQTFSRDLDSAPPATETRARVATFSRDHEFKCTHGNLVQDYCADCELDHLKANDEDNRKASLSDLRDSRPSSSTDSGIVERLRLSAHWLGKRIGPEQAAEVLEAASRIETLEKEREEAQLVAGLNLFEWMKQTGAIHVAASQRAVEDAHKERDDALGSFQYENDRAHEAEDRAEKAEAEAKRLREALKHEHEYWAVRVIQWKDMPLDHPGVKDANDHHDRIAAALQEPSHG